MASVAPLAQEHDAGDHESRQDSEGTATAERIAVDDRLVVLTAGQIVKAAPSGRVRIKRALKSRTGHR